MKDLIIHKKKMKSVEIKNIKPNERILTNIETYFKFRFSEIDENIRNEFILYPLDYFKDSELKFKYELDIDYYKRKFFNTKCNILNDDLKLLISSFLSTKVYFVFNMDLNLFHSEDTMHPLLGLSSTCIEYPRYTTEVTGEYLFKCRDIINKFNKLTVLRGNKCGKLGMSNEVEMKKEICNYIYHLGLYFCDLNLNRNKLILY